MSKPSKQLFTVAAGTTDALIVEHLSFHERARACSSWRFVEPEPPVVVSSRADGAEWSPTPLSAELRAKAVETGVVSVRTERSRGYDFHSYHTRGLLHHAGRYYQFSGTSAHENRNHDFVSGSLRVQELFPVTPARAHVLANNALAIGKIQLAITLGYFAQDPLDGLDGVASREALEDVEWRISRLAWEEVVVRDVKPMKRCPYMVRVRGTLAAGAKSNPGLRATVHGARFELEYVPRAGAAQLMKGG